ncbi:hypothetical protein ABLG96_21735 [Nakamurella sp. A5-74]|uniref:DNA-binding protein n=1 Tax=Nakamurella sp. A5-74 TaxID=3158264 RepID=A0AAU8DR08_9ACTN
MTMTMTRWDTAATLSLGDIARLAEVQRPVVSMWRSRSAGTAVPFPAPCAGSDVAGPRFAAADVADWLTATGRGNNADAAREVLLHSDIHLIDGPDREPLQALLSLLALQAQCGELPDDIDDLLDLADQYDPDDDLLYSELTRCEALLPQLLPLAGALSEAAYGSAGAARAVGDRRARTLSAAREPALTETGARVLRALTAALVRRRPGAVVCDATGAASALLPDLDEEVAIGAIGGPTGPVARAARRELVTQGVTWRNDVAPTVTLLGLPSAEAPAATSAALLQAITDHRATCPPETVTLVWGPAAALTDSITRDDRGRTDDDERCDGLRRRLLSSGKVRAIVRLPAGLRLPRSRERLALWCFGPTEEANEPRTVTADLADRAFDEVVLSGLVSDVLAGLDGSRGLRARQLEVCQIRTKSWLGAAKKSLVPPARRSERAHPTVVLLDRYDKAVAALTGSVADPPLVPTVQVRTTPYSPLAATMSQLISERALGYRAGLRMTQAVDTDDGGVPVLDARSGAEPVATLDRFDLNLTYPQLQYTDPGDVVFCTSGRPRAFVDRKGGAVVRHPSRVLRSTDVRLIPASLAAAINAREPGETAWRTWSIPLIDHLTAPSVRSGLAALDDERRRLAVQLAAVADAEQALLDLAAGGAVDIDSPVPVERSSTSTVDRPSTSPMVERRRSRDPGPINHARDVGEPPTVVDRPPTSSLVERPSTLVERRRSRDPDPDSPALHDTDCPTPPRTTSEEI